MKKLLTLVTLATKLSMLLCVAGMGIMGAVDAVETKVKTPCHQVAETSATDNVEPCEMCETALNALDNDGVFLAEINETPSKTQAFMAAATTVYFFTDTKPRLVNYPVYFPPPDAQLKSVTPLTKTVVLVV